MGLDRLRVNQQIKVEVIEGPYAGAYYSRIADIGENYVKISVPINKGEIVLLRPGLSINVLFTGNDAAFYFSSRIIAHEKDRVSLLIIEPPETIERKQRRKYFRLDVRRNIKYRVKGVDEEFIGARTFDISGGGVGITLEEPLKIGTILELYLELTGVEEEMIIGRVVNQHYQGRLGVVYTEIEESCREAIIQWIFDYQRQLRQKGLI